MLKLRINPIVTKDIKGIGADLSKCVSFRTDYKYAIWEDYVIIYKVEKDYVEIYRVINRYQDIIRIFD